jgi:leucyl aminopeptidase (aminopeptidase T)
MEIPNLEDLFVATFDASLVRDNIDAVLEPYEQGKAGLIRVKPDYQPDEKYLDVAKQVVFNIGNFKKGERTFLRTHYNSVDMSLALAERMQLWGNEVYIILFHGDKVLDSLLRGTDEEKIKEYREKYFTALKSSQHWSSVTGLEKYELSAKAKDNIGLFQTVTKPYWELIDEQIRKGQIKSYDMINNPTSVCADNIGMDYEEYRMKIFEAMKVDAARLFKEETESATQTYGKFGDTQEIIEGRKGKFQIEIGDTALTFEVSGRQILRDCGKAGVDVDMHEGYRRVTTNNPPGEQFVAPVESSVNGHIHTDIQKQTISGFIGHLFGKIENGVIVEFETDRPDIFNKDFPTVAEKTVAEIGRGGFNRKLNFLREIGKPTKDAIIDEKVYDLHIAFGSNTGWGGKNKAAVHEDFSIPTRIAGKNVPLIVRQI